MLNFNTIALALISGAQAVNVYETVFSTNVVYVDANGNPVNQAASAPAPAKTVSPDNGGNVHVFTELKTHVYTVGGGNGNNAGNNGYQQSAPAAPAAPAPAATSAASPPAAGGDSGSSSGSDSDSGSAPAGDSGSGSGPSSSPSASSGSDSAAPSGSADTGDSEFSKDCVNYHNEKRSQHHANPVSWNQTLADYAANYLKGNCVFAHSHGPYGENIAMGYDSPDAAMQAWYDEVGQYSYAAATFSMSTGHFTQMVWKGTTSIGCAQTECGSSGAFFACEYYPPGNMIGDFAQNVS